MCGYPFAGCQADTTLGTCHNVLANGGLDRLTRRKYLAGCLRRTRSGMRCFFRPEDSGFFYIKSSLVGRIGCVYMTYLRGIRRDGCHAALHPECYSGVLLRPRLGLSILAKISSCISTNWLGTRHLTDWCTRRRGERNSAPEVPYRGRCRLRFVVGCGDVDVVVHSTSTAAATLGVWSCSTDAAAGAFSPSTSMACVGCVQSSTNFSRRPKRSRQKFQSHACEVRLIHSRIQSW
jgi:hypothetical protein